MKIESMDSSLLFSTTNIPDVFFTDYLSMTNGNYVKVFLYALFLSKYNKEIKINDLSKTLSLDFKIIQEAFKYWEDAGVFTKKNNGYIINNLQEIELNKLYTPKITINPEDAVSIQKSEYRAKAIESINTLCFQGTMSPSWYNDISLWFEKYKFDEQVMISLFQYCFNKSALHRNYIQTVAKAWYDKKIFTYNDLEKYFLKQDKIIKTQKDISKKLGLTRPLTSFEKDYVNHWINDYNYGLNIIDIALKKTTSKSNPNFEYINTLLKDWNEHNLRSKEDVEKYLIELKEQQKSISKLKKSVQNNNTNFKARKYDNLDSVYANN